MKSILFADDTVLVQSDNNLGKLQNSVNHEMTKVMDWLTANKLSLNISKTKYMLITNKHVRNESFVLNVNRNRMTYKYLGVIVDEKLTWKEHCKQLCSTISKYYGVMYEVKHYVIMYIVSQPNKLTSTVWDYCLGKSSFMSFAANIGCFKPCHKMFTRR